MHGYQFNSLWRICCITSKCMYVHTYTCVHIPWGYVVLCNTWIQELLIHMNNIEQHFHTNTGKEHCRDYHHKSFLWCPTLCDPLGCSLLGSSIHGICQARALEWVAISFSRGSSQARDRIQVSGKLFSQPSIYGMVTTCMTRGQHCTVDMSDDCNQGRWNIAATKTHQKKKTDNNDSEVTGFQFQFFFSHWWKAG